MISDILVTAKKVNASGGADRSKHPEGGTCFMGRLSLVQVLLLESRLFSCPKVSDSTLGAVNFLLVHEAGTILAH